MRRAITFAAATAATAVFGVFGAGPASAHDCFNASRPAPAALTAPLFSVTEDGTTVTGYNPTGNWIWLQFTDTATGTVLMAFWGFEPPENYQHGEGFALLDQYLNGHGRMCETPNRVDVTNLRGVNAGFCLGGGA